MRISRPAWNIFLKFDLWLSPKTDNPITIDFHDTWDTLIQQNNKALHNRPGIGYLINHGRPSGLEWTCIRKAAVPSTHVHNSFKLQKLIESKTIDWAITKDWTNQHVQLSHLEWDNLEIPKIAYKVPFSWMVTSSNQASRHTSKYYKIACNKPIQGQNNSTHESGHDAWTTAWPSNSSQYVKLLPHIGYCYNGLTQ